MCLPAITAVPIILAILPTIAVGLRLWAKAIGRRGLNWSDWLIILADIMLVGYWIVIVIAMTIEANLTNTPDEEAAIILFEKISFSATVVFFAACYLCKMSVVCLYYIIFPSRTLQTLTICVGTLTALAGLASILTALFTLQPISKNWTASEITATDAVNENIVSIFTDVASLITDVVIFTLPLRQMWSLRIQPSKKKALIVTFMLGFITCLEVIIRIGVWYSDPSGLGEAVADILNGLEPSIAVVAVCIPTLRPLVSGNPQNATTPSGAVRQGMGPSNNSGGYNPENHKHLFNNTGASAAEKGQAYNRLGSSDAGVPSNNTTTTQGTGGDLTLVGSSSPNLQLSHNGALCSYGATAPLSPVVSNEKTALTSPHSRPAARMSMRR